MLLIEVANGLIEKRRNKGRSKESLRGYMSDLKGFNKYLMKQFNGPVYVEDITTENVEEYLNKRKNEDKLAPASVNRFLNSIRICLEFAVKQKIVAFNAAEDIEPLKVNRAERTHLSLEELNELLEALEHKIIKEACRLMAYTGARVSECTDLTLDDVDFEQNVIRIINGKGGKDRIVPLNAVLKGHLLHYKNNIRPKYIESDKFFATKVSGELSPAYINRRLHQTTKKLGWEKHVTCHILRHTFASQLVSKNVNIVKISKMLGHADVRTTSIYTHSNIDELAEAVNLLS